jgi:hypothetical protein
MENLIRLQISRAKEMVGPCAILAVSDLRGPQGILHRHCSTPRSDDRFPYTFDISTSTTFGSLD